MFGNFFEDWKDPFDYETVKKNAVTFNKKVIKFWSDFYKDILSQDKIKHDWNRSNHPEIG